MQKVFSKRVLVALAITLIASVGIYLWQLFLIPVTATEHFFRIEESDDTHRIAWNLKREGIIKHRTFYYFTNFIYGSGAKPAPGVYKLRTDMQIRTMVSVLERDPWAVSVTLPAGLSKDRIGGILGDKLGWSSYDKEYFVQTYAGMQWQHYHDDLEDVFTNQYNWNHKKAETFLTLSALYADGAHDFFKKMYEAGTYEIPLGSSRAQAAGILIDQFALEREREKMDNKSTLLRYIDKKAMDNISKLIEDEMILMPDIVALPPLDVTLKDVDGRTYLLFTTSYWNRGRGPLEFVPDPATREVSGDYVRKVFQRIYDLAGGYTERVSGSFLWHDPHHHYHYEDFALYNLAPASDPLALEPEEASVQKLSQKSTFCIRDYNPVDLSHPGANKDSSYKVCGKERQGISPGWADSYYYSYVDQRFDVTDFPEGNYRLTITINPVDRFEEITKDNNVGEALIALDVRNKTAKVLEEKQYGI